MIRQKGIKLKFAISFLVLLTALSTAIVTWYLSIHELKNTLTTSHLNDNYQYAQKVSSSTNDLILTMQQNLEALARILGEEEFSQKDLDDWREANISFFNSIFTTDAEGVVQLMTPPVLPHNQSGVKPGTKITSDLMKQALRDKKPFISDPYLAQTGNLVVLVSYPIFDKAGNYKGVVDGTIYLASNNALARVLGHHEFLDKSSVFVVDHSGRIIYHPDSSRVNESIADHPMVKKVLQGKSGSSQIVNNREVEYFSGYSYVEVTSWGVIAQTPTSIIKAPMHELTKKLVVQSLPLLLLIILLAWFLANYLSKPINKLARFSEEAIASNKMSNIFHHLEIKSSIYEVRQLYQHLQQHFLLLNSQIHQDGLTGLANRRAFDLVMDEWMHYRVHFSLIMLDIDRFKKVNDEHGHLVGDDVLRFLAKIIHEVSREEDICYRYGGEEFAILLKNKNESDAIILAERLRTTIAQTPSPTGQHITVSFGISTSQKEDQKPEDIISRADAALYQSKKDGRNRTTIYRG